MAQFEVSRDSTFLCIKVRGKLEPQEVIATIVTHYPDATLLHKLWDMTEGDFSSFDEAALDSVAAAVAAIPNPTGAHVRTAFVTRNYSLYALLMRYSLQAFKRRARAEYNVFPDVAEAWEWCHGQNR